ncbi:MAG: hypothetical protein E7377_02315 [Clostridiales bacterium]|nr:hypothetical protein [Clostridiales bacterium]
MTESILEKIMKFVFVDKENICTYHDGKTVKAESTYITNYRENSKREQKNREWKQKSDMMLYDDFYGMRNERVVAQINSVSPTLEENKCLYTFSVNETSGIYYKYFDGEKNTEAHFLSSNEYIFKDVTINSKGEITGTVQKDFLSSDIAVFSKNGGDYKCVTGGDSKDENPFSDGNGNIWFNSYGIGRDVNNEFVKYGCSEILKLDTARMEIETILSSEKYSYVKPIVDKNGDLYCIRTLGEEKEKQNVFLQVLLIPVRIVQALIGFVSMFVTIFAGKPLVEGKGKTRSGNGAAKHADGKQIFINNHLLNVEQEMKRNKKTADSGFIPHGWKLIKIKPASEDFSVNYNAETAEEIASGVADFALTEENGQKIVLYTNGKHIFSVVLDGEKKRKKLVNTDFCVKLGVLSVTEEEKTAKQNEEDIFFNGL